MRSLRMFQTPQLKGEQFVLSRVIILQKNYLCAYELMSANERGYYAIAPMGVEFGICQGRYEEMELPWRRWWDNQDMSGVSSQ